MLASEIEALFTTAIAEAANGNSQFFIEADLPGDDWMQLTWDAININYPTERDPHELIAALDAPPYVAVEDVKPGVYLTLSHGAEDLPKLSAFVERLIAAR